MEYVEEKKFLAYLLHDKANIAKTLNKITPDHLPNTYYTYRGIISYYNKYKDIVTLDYLNSFFDKNKVDNAKRTKVINDINDANYFDNSAFNEGEFNALCDLLNTNYKRKKLIDVATKVLSNEVNTCNENKLIEIEDYVKDIINNIDIDNEIVKSEGSIQDTVAERAERYKQIEENPDMIVTYPTGFKKIDEANGGFAPGELIYIIGRKGGGKSVLMLNISHYLWANGYNVILFSLEISKNDYMRRFDSHAAGISTNGLKRGTLTAVEKEAFNEYLQKQAEGLTLTGNKAGIFYVVDVPGTCTPAFIENKVKEVEQKRKCTFQVIVSDYAGIMSPDTKKSELRHEKAQIAFELKQIARKYDKVVITAEQMNRAGKNQKKTDNDAIAESDAVADHIDWGIAIRQGTDPDIVTIESFKTRDAEPFEFNCKKRFDKMTFEELDDLSNWDL